MPKQNLTKNAAGRMVPTEVNGKEAVPYQGVAGYRPTGRKAAPPIATVADYPADGKKLVPNIKEALKAAGIRDGMTISSHHHLRNGDFVANAVFDATDALMLSGETAIGKYPVEAVRTMRSIATIAEKELRRGDATLAAPLVAGGFLDFADSVARAAADTAEILNARVIVAFTQSGSTARLVSKCRPRMPIVAATPLPETARRCSLYWGVQPLLIEPVNDTDEMIGNVDAQLRDLQICAEGDVIIITAGTPIGRRGTTNTMKVHVIGS